MKGVSGIMRVKNDAEFITASIASCINALDELIVVYNDCTDNSAEIIDVMRQRYPQKIRVFEYPYRVFGVGLTKDEYEAAKELPDDSPALLCNYYNFALSKVRYDYAIKIDADQIYFTERLKKWCDVVREGNKEKGSFLLGSLFNCYFRIYRLLCLKMRKRLPLMPKWLVSLLKPHYEYYAIQQTIRGKSCLSVSGINVFKDIDWNVSLGLKHDSINVLPPFNGENDHLLFRVSDKTYYRKFDMEYYNLISNSSYSLIEEFVHPYKPMLMGFCWFHLNSMRNRLKKEIQKVKKDNPAAFMPIGQFLSHDYRDVERRTDKRIHTLYQRILFSYIYNADKESIKANVGRLDKL